MIRLLKKIIAAPFVLLAAVVILLEDWLWDDLARLAAALGRLPVFHQTEAFIRWLPPYPSLLLFAVPSLLLFPVKFFSLYLIAAGQPFLGFFAAAAAKVVGTALVARIFNLTKEKLITIGWFAFLYRHLTAFKKRLYAAIKATAVYRYAHRRTRIFKIAFRRWRGTRRNIWRKRWEAARRLIRRSQKPLEKEE